jgi:hypothetical protein
MRVGEQEKQQTATDAAVAVGRGRVQRTRATLVSDIHGRALAEMQTGTPGAGTEAGSATEAGVRAERTRAHPTTSVFEMHRRILAEVQEKMQDHDKGIEQLEQDKQMQERKGKERLLTWAGVVKYSCGLGVNDMSAAATLDVNGKDEDDFQILELIAKIDKASVSGPGSGARRQKRMKELRERKTRTGKDRHKLELGKEASEGKDIVNKYAERIKAQAEYEHKRTQEKTWTANWQGRDRVPQDMKEAREKLEREIEQVVGHKKLDEHPTNRLRLGWVKVEYRHRKRPELKQEVSASESWQLIDAAGVPKDVSATGNSAARTVDKRVGNHNPTTSSDEQEEDWTLIRPPTSPSSSSEDVGSDPAPFETNTNGKPLLSIRGGCLSAFLPKSWTTRLDDHEQVPATLWYLAGGIPPKAGEKLPTGKQLREWKKKSKGEGWGEERRGNSREFGYVVSRGRLFRDKNGGVKE